MSFNHLIGLLVFGVLFASACGGPPQNSNSNQANVDRRSDAVQTNPEELGLLIKVPFEPDEIADIAWKLGGGSKSVTAVIRLTPEGIVRANKDLFGGVSVGRATIDVRSWFPEELRTQSEMNGDVDLAGDLVPIDNFTQSPYTSGRVIRIDNTDFFVVELAAQ